MFGSIDGAHGHCDVVTKLPHALWFLFHVFFYRPRSRWGFAPDPGRGARGGHRKSHHVSFFWMTMSTSIGVVGAGAIGCYVGGLLAPHTKLTFLGKPRQQETIGSHGFTVVPLRGPATTLAPTDFSFATEAAELATCDMVLVAVKSGQTAEVAGQLAEFARKNVLVVSLQNGVANPPTIRQAFARVLATIVSFNVVIETGEDDRQTVRQTTSGPLIIETSEDGGSEILESLTTSAGIESKLSPDIAAEQWSKLVINLSNSINALAGVPTRDMLTDAGYRKIIGAVTREALDVLDAAKIRPAKMRGVPLRLLTRVLSLPSPIARLALRSRLKIDPRARSSMWQDLNRRRPTEVEYLNGEIVSLGETHGHKAPLNQRLVELIKDAVAANRGSPEFSSKELLAKLND